MLHLGVVTLMPEMFVALEYGVTGRAISQGLARFNTWNPRSYGLGQYHQVDDKPYGGGPGMVMLYEPLRCAIEAALKTMPAETLVVYMSPQGKPLEQDMLNRHAKCKTPLLLLAGRYEGIDERIITDFVDEEWSVGDYVLSGGELPAMVVIDALLRLLPGSLGHQASSAQDSFMDGLLDYPHYTRPAIVGENAVPKVLLSGNHQDIAQWRRMQSLGRTWLKRPDLLDRIELSDKDNQLLAEFKREF